MSDIIRHNGIIDTVTERRVRVRILQTSACSACKVAGHCSASESKEKLVDVDVSNGLTDYSVGDQVVVSTTASAVGKAMVVGFVLPFVVMVGALLVALLLTFDELLSALVALASLVLYYLLIYMLRSRLGRSVTFSIEK